MPTHRPTHSAGQKTAEARRKRRRVGVPGTWDASENSEQLREETRVGSREDFLAREEQDAGAQGARAFTGI